MATVPSAAAGLPTPDSTVLSTELFRRVAGTFATGVTIITAQAPDGPHGCTVNAFSSLSLTPPLVLACIDQEATTHPRLVEAGAFAVNIMGAHSGVEDLCRFFATKATSKFEEVSTRSAVTGAPILEGAIGWLDCWLETAYDAGDHTIFIGRVAAADMVEGGEPILFHGGRFASIGARGPHPTPTT